MLSARNGTAKTPLKTTLVVLMSLLLSGLAVAQGDLYGDDAPADAAWIRIINIATPEALTVTLDGTELAAGHGEASGYLAVEPGAHGLSDGAQTIELTTEPGSFLTVAFRADGPLVIEDPALRDISRGLLGLMNLTARQELALITPEGDTIVEQVAPGEARAIQVSAARTGLEVTEGGETIAMLDEHPFERGEAYTVLVFEGEDGPVAMLVTASGMN